MYHRDPMAFAELNEELKKYVASQEVSTSALHLVLKVGGVLLVSHVSVGGTTIQLPASFPGRGTGSGSVHSPSEHPHAPRRKPRRPPPAGGTEALAVAILGLTAWGCGHAHPPPSTG